MIFIHLEPTVNIVKYNHLCPAVMVDEGISRKYIYISTCTFSHLQELGGGKVSDGLRRLIKRERESD